MTATTQTDHLSTSGDCFKVFPTVHRDGSFRGYVWAPISCFLSANWRGPFATHQAAVDDGLANWTPSLKYGRAA